MSTRTTRPLAVTAYECSNGALFKTADAATAYEHDIARSRLAGAMQNAAYVGEGEYDFTELTDWLRNNYTLTPKEQS